MEDRIEIENQPIICSVKCSETEIEKFKENMKRKPKGMRKIILNYPTVYLYMIEERGKYDIYVGETTDIIRRSFEHFYISRKDKGCWEEVLKEHSADMIIMGHEHFNKSLTLDIEHRLILYMSAMENVRKVYNKRGNEQNEYYTSDERDDIFRLLWKELNKHNPYMFPVESLITDSSVYKASPFHRLSEEQYEYKMDILAKTEKAIESDKMGQLIFVAGEAGTGKTVFLSSLFYTMSMGDEDFRIRNMEAYLLVNHEEQINTYLEITKRLDIYDKDKENVCKPTHFINTHDKNHPADVILVDEAHLLLTRGKQSYRGENHLYDLLEMAKVVIAVFDRKQILRVEQMWEEKELERLEKTARLEGNYLILKHQFRIKADAKTIKWIRDFIDNQEVNKIPQDTKGYEIKIFDSPKALHEAIKRKAANEETALSRLIATFDWPYIDKKRPKNKQYWEVEIGDWSLPWNKQRPLTRKEKKKNKNLAWAEKKYTIDEVGSTFTIQGFDLNYAGVILGPSVKYRNGKIVFDPSLSKNKGAIQKKSLHDGTKKSFGEILLRNETNVLMTRGVSGLYIYACDDELRAALKAKSSDK